MAKHGAFTIRLQLTVHLDEVEECSVCYDESKEISFIVNINPILKIEGENEQSVFLIVPKIQTLLIFGKTFPH